MAIQIWVICTVTQCHGDFWARTAAEGHGWVCPLATAIVCVDIPSFCYHERPCQCQKSGLPPGDMVSFRHELLPKALLGSLSLQQPGSELMPMASVNKGHANAWGLGIQLIPCWCLRTMLPLGPYSSKWTDALGAMVMSGLSCNWTWVSPWSCSSWRLWLYLLPMLSCEA